MNDPAPPAVYASAIEDYAIIGDCMTAALVARNGSIDWLCLPRFDSAACFAALLGTPENGRFLIAPEAEPTRITRSYRDGSLVLDTVFTTAEGEVVLTDFMVPGAQNNSIVRTVEGRHGRVRMQLELAIRLDYGITIPWVTRRRGGNGLVAIAGPDMIVLRTEVALEGRDMKTVASFDIAAGEKRHFVLTYSPSHLPPPPSLDADDALFETERYWTTWSARCQFRGPNADAVRRSLLVLKALTYAPTGGIVAALTTSLPEQLGGQRNWDYRFCWLRDAVITLFAFMGAGYMDEAASWANWLHRSVAGSPAQLQIMYGIAGERRLEERELPWLPGYQGAAPVRTGNAAADQLQLDVYGEVIAALTQARRAGLLPDGEAWMVEREMLEHLETVWEQPDEGMWETRGGRKHFTFSKVMAWAAFDQGIEDAETNGFDGPLDRWRATRDLIRARILDEGFDVDKNSFVQSFGSKELDASLLLLPTVGFVAPDDPRMRGTVEAIERELLVDGFVLRYRTEDGGDGLPPGEGAFLACSFWLASSLHDLGRKDDARAMFDRLVGLCNDVGLLSEEYDPHAKRFTGNFPQAFSHVALVNTAMHLAGAGLTRSMTVEA